MNLKVSIIIIAENWNKFLEESLPYYSDLDYNNYEIFVFTTEPVINKKYPNVKFINDISLKNKPAERRDLAIKYATTGDLYAFIDDDAYPTKGWLREAVKHFKNENVTAVGGPGITPENATALEKASGWISASPLGGFGSTYRFIPQKETEIDDYPSMNLIVRAEDFKKVGGFDSGFYPGEDTKLCLDLTKKLGKKIIYEPKAVVYHHKRPLFTKHLIQNGRFGLHRGYFAKILPETSFRWFYLIPSLFSLGFIGGMLILLISFAYPTTIVQTLADTFLAIFGVYILLLMLNALWILYKSKDAASAFLSIPGVFTTHIWYGLRFIQGYFFSKKMNDVYGRV